MDQFKDFRNPKNPTISDQKCLGSALGMDKSFTKRFLTMAVLTSHSINYYPNPQDLDLHQTNDTLAHQLIKKYFTTSCC